MAALKLYLVIVSEDDSLLISVHRDMSTLSEEWLLAKRDTSVGIVHVGFLRPKIKDIEAIRSHRGKVLTSAAAKWALTEEYQSSASVVAEIELSGQMMPLHLLLIGMGFDISEPSAGYQISSSNLIEESARPMIKAIESVLKSATVPLNKEEIFARIVDQELYPFKETKPLAALESELNIHSRRTDDNDAHSNPRVNRLEGDRFQSAEASETQFSGWVSRLMHESPEFAEQAKSHGIYNDESYLQLVHSLPIRLRDQLDVFRFSSLVRTIDSSDPVALLKILPRSLMTPNVASIGLPVRILNVFRQNRIAALSDLENISIETMLKWPNFGRKSVGDFCEILKESVVKLGDQLAWNEVSKLEENPEQEEPEVESASGSSDEGYQLELVASVPLKAHFEKMLMGLKGNHRQVMEDRTGYNGTVMTLETVGESLGVTRERVRQIQKKHVTRVIETEFWDDCIALKIGQLLIDRGAPLYLEMLELEDPWFEGFMGNYQHLAAIIELFSENEIRIININGASVVSRIRHDTWDECVNHFRSSLKDKAKEGNWSRHDIELTFHAELSDKGAQELVPLMWDEFKEALQFEDESAEAKLLTFGVSAESVVQAVLLQAESPLHYSEVAIRATELLGKPVDERRAQNALMSQGAKLYGRGIYGLAKFNPISPRMCKNIQLVVAKLIYDGPLMKQWHANEILTALQAKFSALPKELDNYILNIILQDSDNLAYLNRMVWVRADSNQSVHDRIDMADAFTKILEDNGGPLKGKELKERLAAIRGVPKTLQLHATERMILIGPDLWGLAERDVGDAEDNETKLDILYQELKVRQKGIHVSEVDQFVEVSDDSKQSPSAYTLMNLAQRDDRFYLGRAMFLGLATWDGDVRRLNLSEAVRQLCVEMEEPMSLSKIHARIEDLTEMSIDNNFTGLLLNEGLVYDSNAREWFKE